MSFEKIYYDARNVYKKNPEEAKTKKNKKKYNFKPSEVYARGPNGYKMVQFYSRSKDPDARYLSSMQSCELHIDGKTYMSMEHYFQAQKFPSNKRKIFEKDGEIKTAKEAKKAASKSGMKKYNVTLDKKTWNGMSKEYPNEFHRIRVMKKAIWARFKQDKRFRDILCRPKTYFIHYEKKRGKYDPRNIPAWGSYKSKVGGWSGLNILGLLYIEIARFHSIKDWLGTDQVNWSIKIWKNGDRPFKAWEKCHPLIPHMAICPRKEWKYAGFYTSEGYNTCLDSSVILHC